MQLKRLFSTDSVKGTRNYLNTQKKYEILRTVLYFAIDPEEYGCPMDEEDFGYTWGYLSDSLPFWHSAAEKGLWVLFDVDQ